MTPSEARLLQVIENWQENSAGKATVINRIYGILDNVRQAAYGPGTDSEKIAQIKQHLTRRNNE